MKKQSTIENIRSEAIVIGVSAGGFEVIKKLVSSLPSEFSLPIIIVQHIGDFPRSGWVELFNKQCLIQVKEADEKESIIGGTVYLAPPNYHLLIEKDKTFTLTIDERVNYARPAIDVLFETAAEAYGASLVGIVGTGGNSDGAKGLLRIKELGGVTIVQDPTTAEVNTMPVSAIQIASPLLVIPVASIIKYILELHFINLKYHDLET
tara:strand:+ start:3281 stop:3901 length:621 start_codon:yes stop_codon:yes gene_type:complete